MEQDDTRELWLPGEGCEGRYHVSELGRLRSITRRALGSNGVWQTVPGRINQLNPGFGGYVLASLYLSDRVRKVRMHTLVLETFVGPCPPQMECLHIDGDPSNNCVWNLKWGTSSANKFDVVRHGNHFGARKTHCPRGHQLAHPNLVPSAALKGHRACLACRRANGQARYYWRQGRYYDFVGSADAYYAEIMKGAA